MKSIWATDQVEYLGFKLTKQGILPQSNKIKAIINVQSPCNKKQSLLVPKITKFL